MLRVGRHGPSLASHWQVVHAGVCQVSFSRPGAGRLLHVGLANLKAGAIAMGVAWGGNNLNRIKVIHN